MFFDLTLKILPRYLQLRRRQEIAIVLVEFTSHLRPHEVNLKLTVNGFQYNIYI